MSARVRYFDTDFLAPENDVVIAGISGRFSESANMDEFYDNLINHVDLITDDERRFPRGFNGIHIFGKIKELDKFDSHFFSQSPKNAEIMSPEMRMGIECAYEAIVDAGMSLDLLHETRTGVYIANTISDAAYSHYRDVHDMKPYVYINTTNTILASKIAVTLGLNGPNMSVDTACSSGLYVLEDAVRAIRTGVVDQAIVGGITCFLGPFVGGDFAAVPLGSQTHRRCKPFDISADGYSRGEGGAYVFLQRKEDCRRSYASVVHIATNSDGKSETGFLAPWGWRHYQMLRDVYTQAKIDPKELSYLECHGTGTKAGDPQEILGLTTNDFVTKGRSKDWPLLIGSVKSNHGHSECSAGLVALSKIVLSMKYGVIPANLHYNIPNPKIPALLDGTVKVVTENTPYEGGYIGINSFGLGGANAHAIIRDTATRQNRPSPAGKDPRLFTYATRTEAGANHVLEFVQKHSHSLELQALLAPSATMEPYKMPVRCYAVLNGSKQVTEIETVTGERPPVWFVFPGMGCQWEGMGRNMMRIPKFRETIERLSKFTQAEFGLDLLSFFTEEPHAKSLEKKIPLIPIIAVQIALIDMVRAVGLEPDKMFGHSNGEVACAYADGCLTAEQTLAVAYIRATLLDNAESHVGRGKMAAVGISLEECRRRCPPGVYTACHNAQDSVTISGNAAGVDSVLEQLRAEGIFAKEVVSGGKAFHTPEISQLDDEQRKRMGPVIPNPKPRSSKWISTSFTEEDLALPAAQTASVEYLIHSTVNMVYFHQAVLQIPRGAIVLEIGPHGLLSSVVKRTMENQLTSLALMRRNHEDNVGLCLGSLGKCHLKGININPLALHPPVPFPVPLDTPMISSTISKAWDHSVSWHTPSFSDYCYGGDTVDFKLNIDKRAEFENMAGHVVDGSPTLPKAAHIYFVWKTLARKLGKDVGEIPVQFKDVKFHKQTVLNLASPVTLKAKVSAETGQFEVCSDAGDLLCSGHVSELSAGADPLAREHPGLVEELDSKKGDNCTMTLTQEEFYSLFTPPGYSLIGDYRGVAGAATDLSEFTLRWNGDWCCFLEAMLHSGSCAFRPAHLQDGIRGWLTSVGMLTIDPTTMQKVTQDGNDKSVCLRALTKRLEKKVVCRGAVLQNIQVRYETPGVTSETIAPSINTSAFVPYMDAAECLISKQDSKEALQNYAKQCASYALGRLQTVTSSSNISSLELGSLKETLATLLISTSSVALKEHEIKTFEATYTADIGCVLAELLVKCFDHLSQNGTADVASVLASFDKTLMQDKLLGSLTNIATVKSVLDIILDNTALSEPGPCKLTVLEMGGSGSRMFSRLIPLFDTEPRVQLWKYDLAEVNAQSYKSATENFPRIGRVEFSLTNPGDKEKNSKSASTHSADAKPTDGKSTYNCIVLKDVLHKQISPKAALIRAMNQLTPDGFLLVSEVTDNFPLAYLVSTLMDMKESSKKNNAERDHAQTNGVAEDTDNQRYLGRFYTDAAWLKLFRDVGLQLVLKTSDGAMSSLYLLRSQRDTVGAMSSTKRAAAPHVVIDLDRESHHLDSAASYSSFLSKVKTKISQSGTGHDATKVWLVSSACAESKEQSGAPSGMGLVSLTRLLQMEGLGQTVRCAVVDDITNNSASPDLSHSDSAGFVQLRENDLAVNVYRKGQWGYTCLLPIEGKGSNASAPLRPTDDACLVACPSNDFSKVEWRQSLGKAAENTNTTLTVYYAGLHPSDQALIAGKLTPSALYSPDVTVLGRDAAGRLGNGRRVMAAIPSACRTKVDITDHILLDVPDHWSLEQAATVPTAYSAAYYLWDMRSHLRPGDNLLIMDVLDPVALAITRLALHKQVNVVVTVPTETDRALVSRTLPELSTERVVCRDSTVRYTRRVAELAGDRGIDVIVSNLEAEESRASLVTLNSGGTFFYIGEHGVEDLQCLKAGAAWQVSVTIVDVPTMLCGGGERAASVRREVALLVAEGIKSGVVKPLNRRVFAAKDTAGISTALSTGQGAQQLVIKIQEESETLHPTSPAAAASIPVPACTTFDPSHCYLLVGGLGRFGIEVAHWMVKRGARHLLISARGGITSALQQYKITKMIELGAEVNITDGTPLTLDGATRLCRKASQMGGFGGVFAISMSPDNTDTSSHWSLAQSVNHLNVATRASTGPAAAAAPAWFVVCANIHTVQDGVSADSSGRCFSDASVRAICQRRQAEGLHGLTIHWGPIDGISDTRTDSSTPYAALTLPGSLSALDRALCQTSTLVEIYRCRDRSAESQGDQSHGDSLESREKTLLEKVLDIINLKTCPADHVTLVDSGIDSLGTSEVQQLLQNEAGLSLENIEIRALTFKKIKDLQIELFSLVKGCLVNTFAITSVSESDKPKESNFCTELEKEDSQRLSSKRQQFYLSSCRKPAESTKTYESV